MNPIKTAILSYGMSGKLFHAPFINVHPGFELMGCWERSKKLIQADYPGVRSYSSLEEILEDDSIELVVVNTPTATHYDFTKKVLLAGKHAVVEKAFTTTVEEALELKALAEEKGLVMSVYHNRRFDSDFRTVQKVLNEKLIGDVVEGSISYERYKTTLNVKAHKEEANGGAGLLKDLGPHCIDQALTLFGFPEAVFADIRITRDNSIVDDWFDILLYYPTVRIRLKSSILVREPLPGFVFHGKKGSFIKGRTDIQENSLLAGMVPNREQWGIEPESEAGYLYLDKDGKSVKEKVISLQGNYLDYYDSIYATIREGKPLLVTVLQSIWVMQVIETAIASSEQRKAIAIEKL